MPLDLNQLRTFLAVARHRGHTRAAAHLHVTQSAVSHAVRKLERGLGYPLIESSGRRFALTEQGRHLQQACERIFREVEEVERRLVPGALGARARVVLGATVEFGTTVLIRKMRPFLDAHPELHVDFLFSHDLVQPLLRDEVDVAVDCRFHPHPSVESTPLFRETWSAIASPEFLARHEVRVPRDLEPLPVLSMDREGEWWANLLQALPDEERPSLGRLVVVNHVRGIINAAMDGIGVGLVPRYTVLREIASGALVALFPGVDLLEDQFRIFQKRWRARREENRAVVAYLQGLDAGEYGETMGRAGG
jgi:DNA-binding transcriptional LysR family regulator